MREGESRNEEEQSVVLELVLMSALTVPTEEGLKRRSPAPTTALTTATTTHVDVDGTEIRLDWPQNRNMP